LHPGLSIAINQSIAPAFNQVAQNQRILQNQISAMSMAQPPPTQAQAHQYIVPPILHVAFPMQQPFQVQLQQQQMDLAVDSKASSKEDMEVKAAKVKDAVVVAVDASFILLLQLGFVPRMVKDKWSCTKAIIGASLCCLIHMVE
jgi:hypothetical protein